MDTQDTKCSHVVHFLKDNPNLNIPHKITGYKPSKCIHQYNASPLFVLRPTWTLVNGGKQSDFDSQEFCTPSNLPSKLALLTEWKKIRPPYLTRTLLEHWQNCNQSPTGAAQCQKIATKINRFTRCSSLIGVHQCDAMTNSGTWLQYLQIYRFDLFNSSGCHIMIHVDYPRYFRDRDHDHALLCHQ